MATDLDSSLPKPRFNAKPRRFGTLPFHRSTLAERFWKKVVKAENGCWGWTGARMQFGYGAIGAGGHRGRTLRAHRVSWEIHFGPVPWARHVCHKCDTPSCTNPAHLFLGDDQSNLDDMRAKGRGFVPGALRGESNPQAKLTERIVREIRRRRAAGDAVPTIARDLGINAGTAYGVASRKSWGHVS